METYDFRLRSVEELKEDAAKPVSHEMTDEQIQVRIVTKAQYLIALLLQDNFLNKEGTQMDVVASISAIYVAAGILSTNADIRPSEALGFSELGQRIARVADTLKSSGLMPKEPEPPKGPVS